MIEVSDLLNIMIRLDASDAFITNEAPVNIKVNGEVRPINDEYLNHNDTRKFAYDIMDEDHRRNFEKTKECNFAIQPPRIGRFRVSVFVQRGVVGIVLRKINISIPTIDYLNLPHILKKIVMQKHGLVIMVGGTGTGKSTTQAAMLGHRNTHSHDHIITIEDPIEFIHPHKKSLVTQREVGLDTNSFSIALKNAMRQAPDVILIGEIRDAETMHNAILFSETGHLCLATLYASNTYHALDRIINFFDANRKKQLLMDLSMNLHALVAQRLIATVDGQKRVPAVEVMINTPLIADTILRGETNRILNIIERSNEEGLQTFDQSIFALYTAGLISKTQALRNAVSENNLRLKIKLEDMKTGKRQVVQPSGGKPQTF